MLPNSHELPVRLDAGDVDFKERWKPSSILNHMQLLADRHAEMLHCTRNDILSDGLVWVIARLRVDMEDYPRYGDTVKVKTWPGAPDRLTMPRYFRFTAENGDLLGVATSKYMMIHLESREFVRPGQVNIYDGIQSLLEDVNPQPERIRLKTPTRDTVIRTPLFNDIDMNRHMNNTRYAEWITDLFPTKQFETHMLKWFQINYVSDGREGHRIALDVEESSDRFLVQGSDADNEGKIVFESAGGWQKFE